MSDQQPIGYSWIGHTWIAREFARLYQNFDACDRVPHPLRATFDELGRGSWREIRFAHRPHAEPLTINLSAAERCSTVEEVRASLLPIVRRVLVERGQWSSAFRKYLRNKWRIDAPVRNV